MIQRRLPKPFRGSDHRTLLVAGAAAGVAAIFKAPATGAIFALEVPYRDDMARRMLLPALVASATGYLTFVTLSDTTPLLAVSQFSIPPFELIDLLGALLVGATCAIGARAFAKLMRIAKGFSLRALPIRLFVSSASLVGLFMLSRELTGLSLSAGAGYEVFRDWLFVETDISIQLLVAIFFIRCLASAMTTAGSGVGGVFIPLVVGGGIVGRGVAELIHDDRASLYTLLGIAAFLGAGYRVPLAAVMFVAETTGKPNFVAACPVCRGRCGARDGGAVDHRVPTPPGLRLTARIGPWPIPPPSTRSYRARSCRSTWRSVSRSRPVRRSLWSSR